MVRNLALPDLLLPLLPSLSRPTESPTAFPRSTNCTFDSSRGLPAEEQWRFEVSSAACGRVVGNRIRNQSNRKHSQHAVRIVKIHREVRFFPSGRHVPENLEERIIAECEIEPFRG